MHKTTLKISFLFVLFSFSTTAQEISSKLIDSITNEPIPYANIIFKRGGTISNEEGKFTFLFSKSTNPKDTLFISCIGFETIKKPLNQFKDSIIYMLPKTNELKEVILSSKKYTAREVIAKVQENIMKNYNFDLTKKRIFFRESNIQNFIKTNYTLKKSTIAEFNKPFLDSVLNSLPKSNAYYTEVLCDLYGDFTKEKQKIDLIKASELYDKNNEVGFTAFEEKFERIINQNVKPDSYFKVKSGIFGQKLDMEEFKGSEVDSTDTAELKKKLEEEKQNEADRKTNFSKYRKNSIANMMQGLFFQEKTKHNFINKSGKYNYEITDFTYVGNDAAYVIKFAPKGAADFKGTLYVNMEDFAILRADYENVKNVKNFKLMGISFTIFRSRGKMIFSKGEDNRYSLLYLEKDDASRFGIKRPLKIIEKNKHVKGRRKQNELYVKLDMAMRNSSKNVLVFFDTNTITASTFDSFEEKNTMLPTYMPTYNPEFWKGYNIIEPNQAIKDFTVIE